jgi:hypothetical protein
MFCKPRELHTKITNPLHVVPSAKGRVIMNRKLERITEEEAVVYFKIVPCNFPDSFVVIAGLLNIQNAYEEGHKICWNEAKVLQIEPNTTYRRYNESAHMSLIDHPIRQPSLEFSPIWTHVIATGVTNLHTTPFSADYVGRLCFYVGTKHRLGAGIA